MECCAFPPLLQQPTDEDLSLHPIDMDPSMGAPEVKPTLMRIGCREMQKQILRSTEQNAPLRMTHSLWVLLTPA